ncbi:DUF3726 domain-containing protein [Jannaschia sp. 2305UL9-9]|uniref:DUF3726 domain-containing protein n=1 Tax=Jannaschia sp. 2305UL9-9 TaxID=3121638 RepID=UPI003529BBC3
MTGTQGATGEICLSLSEVAALCRGAARGAGCRWGLAEEYGTAAVWLARHQLDWGEAILGNLASGSNTGFHPAPGVWRSEGNLCPIRAGTALCDFAALPEGPIRGVDLGCVEQPILLLPFVHRVSQKLRLPLRVIAGGTELGVLGPDGCDLHNPRREPMPVGIHPARNVSPKAQGLCRTTSVPARVVARLTDLVMATAVPSSEVSARRAGGDVPERDGDI